jgi:hypothetical protein
MFRTDHVVAIWKVNIWNAPREVNALSASMFRLPQESRDYRLGFGSAAGDADPAYPVGTPYPLGAHAFLCPVGSPMASGRCAGGGTQRAQAALSGAFLDSRERFAAAIRRKTTRPTPGHQFAIDV